MCCRCAHEKLSCTRAPRVRRLSPAAQAYGSLASGLIARSRSRSRFTVLQGFVLYLSNNCGPVIEVVPVPKVRDASSGSVQPSSARHQRHGSIRGLVASCFWGGGRAFEGV